MRVPVVVVNELDGLSKVATGRGQDHQTLEHQGVVRDKARTALAWLRERPAHVKCVTSKGGRETGLLALLPLFSTSVWIMSPLLRRSSSVGRDAKERGLERPRLKERSLDKPLIGFCSNALEETIGQDLGTICDKIIL